MYQFDAFKPLGFYHMLTTRLGGVSQGVYREMNTSFYGNDNIKDVMRNIKLTLDASNMTAKTIVATRQVHGTDIFEISSMDDLKSLTQFSTEGTSLEGYEIYVADGYDGLLTTRDDIILMTFYADCVPVIFYDAEQSVIVNIHSGWRGTQKQFAAKTVKLLINSYQCELENIYVGIGQSAGSCCYEVDQPVIDAFRRSFPEACLKSAVIKMPSEHDPDKYLIDLKQINRWMILHEAVLDMHIAINDDCTICNPEKYHSHRYAKGGARGTMSAFMQLKSFASPK